MRIIIAGGRDFKPSEQDWFLVRDLLIAHRATEIISGGARGADAFGERMGNRMGITVRVFSAEWNKYGKLAGPRRNRLMAEYADAIILMPGGRGTDNMRFHARSNGLKILYDSEAQ